MLRTAPRLAPRRWLVADMDSTLIEKGPGTYPTLAESPCLQPLLTWLERGGFLLCVTSDDGHRPFKHLWEQLPCKFRKSQQVVLSTSDGAAMFRGDPATGDPVEEAAFTATLAEVADPGGEVAVGTARDMLVSFFHGLLLDRTPLDLLPERRAAGFRKVLDKVERGESAGGAEASDSSRAKLAAIFTPDNLFRPGIMGGRGTMLWRNQPGPMDAWVRTPKPEGVQENDWNFHDALFDPPKTARFTNLFIMGMPKAVSGPYILEAAPRLEAAGLEASAAPNSVCIKPCGVSKALPVEFLAGNVEGENYGFALASAVAFGDNPAGNDGPLAEFVDRGMPFVSVAASLEDTPLGLQGMHAGGLEGGTASVIARLNEALEERGGEEAWEELIAGDGLRGIVAAVREENSGESKM